MYKELLPTTIQGQDIIIGEIMKEMTDRRRKKCIKIDKLHVQIKVWTY